MIKLLLTCALILFVQSSIAQKCNPNIQASTPTNRYSANGNEITDTETGLVWQQCSLGQSGNSCSGTANTYTWQEALQVASAPWRLPNVNELRSIVEEKCYAAAVNSTVFPNTRVKYWTSSPSVRYSGKAWQVDFADGEAWANDMYYNYYVRLVRDGG